MVSLSPYICEWFRVCLRISSRILPQISEHEAKRPKTYSWSELIGQSKQVSFSLFYRRPTGKDPPTQRYRTCMPIRTNLFHPEKERGRERVKNESHNIYILSHRRKNKYILGSHNLSDWNFQEIFHNASLTWSSYSSSPELLIRCIIWNFSSSTALSND